MPCDAAYERLPVLDPAGLLLGIVSCADLLKVSSAATTRSPRRCFGGPGVDPDTIGVEIGDGVVTLTGQLERRSLISIAVRLGHGVVGVVDRLTHRLLEHGTPAATSFPTPAGNTGRR